MSDTSRYLTDANGLGYDPNDGWRESAVQQIGTVDAACRCTCSVCGTLAYVWADSDHDHYYDDDDILTECAGHWYPVCSARCDMMAADRETYPKELHVGEGM